MELRFGQLCVLPLMAALLLGCRDRAATPGSQNGANGPKKVRVGRVERAKLDEVIIGTGTLSAHDRAVLSVKVAGRLAAMFVDLGTPVKKGDVVAQIDKTDFLMRREQTAAALAQARARLGVNLSGAEDEVKPENVSVAKEASAVLTEATKTRERIKSLHEQGIVAQADVEST